MAHWEYKVLSGGKMGLGSMTMLEQFLNDLGQQQWEVVSWQTDPESPLKFTGLARRPILRDYAPQEMPAAQDKAAIAAAKEEEEKEREAWVETLAREREVYAASIAAEGSQEDEDEDRDLVGDLFDTLRPLMKRNKRGPGSSGSVSFLAKKLDQSEDDLLGALEEAGLELGATENDAEAHEQGDEMFWLNSNSRGEIWINSMPKSRYRAPQPKKPAGGGQKAEEPKKVEEPKESREPAKPPQPLPEGEALLEKLRPMMRRNRGGRGLSGSLPFLSRALRHTEEELSKALETVGLKLPDDPKAEPATIEIGPDDYWLNKNEKGQVWINARPRRDEAENVEKTAGEPKAGDGAAAALADDGAIPPVLVDIGASNVLELTHPHLAKVGRSATLTALVSDVAVAVGVSQASLLDALVGAGLEVPVETTDKPVVVESDAGQFWFSRSEDDALSLNAKPVRRSRAKKKN